MAIEYPIEELRKIVRYEPDTGKLFWKHRDVSMFSSEKNALRMCNIWNTNNSNKEITCHHCEGYITVRLKSSKFLGHRVAWALYYGEWPLGGGQIDHINGIRDDNRIVNLRVVTNTENQRNTFIRRNNKSGVVGVYRRRSNKKWISQIKVNFKMIYLGSFESIEDAVAARKAAEIQYGFHENHGRELTTNTNQV